MCKWVANKPNVASFGGGRRGGDLIILNSPESRLQFSAKFDPTSTIDTSLLLIWIPSQMKTLMWAFLH